MVDKLRKTFPLSITFSEGEQPTSFKLNSLSSGTRTSTNIIEKAVGDLWNQAGDAALSSFPLQLPNLARMLGANKYLNPVIYPLQSEFEFRDNLGQRYRGQTEGYLTYKPKSGTTFTITAGTTNGQFTTLKASPDLVDLPGDYYIDTSTGWFKIGTPLLADETLQYDVDPVNDWMQGQEVFPGVIPDPRHATNEFTYCRIEDVGGGKYHLHLPPRRPLTFTGTPSDDFGSSRSRPPRYPIANEIGNTGNESNEATATGAPNLYWQHYVNTSTLALADAHYRYSIPEELLNVTAGDRYPNGFMYLWDSVSNTIIEDVIFTKPLSDPGNWIIQIESASFGGTLAARATADETAASYNAGLVSLVICGAPLTRVIWQLQSSFLRHDHSGGNGLHEPVISHNSLVNVNPPEDAGVLGAHDTAYPNHLPTWPSSKYDGDHHTYLLSRTGAQSTGAEQRDTFNNAMLGHLLMANADISGSHNYLDDTLPDDSFRIYFGDLTGPSIYANSNGSLLFNNSSGAGFGFNTAPPADLWASPILYGGQQTGFWGTMGSFRAGIHWNSYRDTSVMWNVQGVNGYTTHGAVEIGNEGILFRHEDAGATGQTTQPPIRMTIDPNGKVGIGTTSPTSKLHIYDAVDRTPNASGTGQVQINGNAYAGYITLGGSADADGMHIGHNSGIRTLHLDVNESPVLTIKGTSVGIGTTTPSRTLHTAGTVFVSDPDLGFTSAGWNKGVEIEEDSVYRIESGAGTYSWAISKSFDDIFRIFSSNADDHTGNAIYSFQIEAQAPTNTLYLDSAGNVGAGTNTPTSKLHIYHATANTDLNIESDGTNSVPHLELTNDARSWQIRNDGAAGDKFTIRDNTAAANRFSINSVGQILINHSDAITAGGINATAQIFGTLGSLSINRYTASANPAYLVLNKSRSGTVGTHSALLSGDEIGRIVWAGSDSATYQDGAYINALTTENWSASALGTKLSFYTTPNGATTPAHAMTIDEDSNVGVGTTGPSTRLHVALDSGTVPTLDPQTVAVFNNSINNTDDCNIAIIAGSGNATTSNIHFGDSTNEANGAIGYNNFTDSMFFSVNGSTRLSISSDGDILIGGLNAGPTGTDGKVLAFGDNGGDPTMGSNSAGIYAKDVSGTVEMFAIDEANNATQISPHDPKTGEWVYYSKNVKTKVVKKVNMEKLVELVELLSGETLLEEWIDHNEEW